MNEKRKSLYYIETCLSYNKKKKQIPNKILKIQDRTSSGKIAFWYYYTYMVYHLLCALLTYILTGSYFYVFISYNTFYYIFYF